MVVEIGKAEYYALNDPSELILFYIINQKLERDQMH